MRREEGWGFRKGSRNGRKNREGVQWRGSGIGYIYEGCRKVYDVWRRDDYNRGKQDESEAQKHNDTLKGETQGEGMEKAREGTQERRLVELYWIGV